MSTRIKEIYGPEPMREGECPLIHAVGRKGITEITEEHENMGTYGINWLVVKAGDTLICKINALHISEIYYYQGDAS